MFGGGGRREGASLELALRMRMGAAGFSKTDNESSGGRPVQREKRHEQREERMGDRDQKREKEVCGGGDHTHTGTAGLMT